MAFQPVEGKAVAVIGGGISGVVAAQTLSAQHEVVLFDFGSRGLGGRCGHREDPKDGLRFDHGAQFLSVGATDSERWKELISSWLSDGLLQLWTPRLREVTAGEAPSITAVDGATGSFFDVASATELYVSPGGMRNLCEGIAGKGSFQSVRGCRVRRLSQGASGHWMLYGNPGNAAHHEASEADAQAADDQYLGSFKVLILTDVMLSFPEWHRAALLGLEAHVPELVGVLKETDMAPLFSLMVSFELGATENVDLDAAVIRTSPVLQWICRMTSKPGPSLKQDCWVCVSTREFAEACLGDEPMSVEGAKGIIYKPQEKESGFARCF